MKSIIRSTIQSTFAISILIPSLHGDVTTTETEICSRDTSVIGNTGSSSKSLQTLLEEPPSIFARIFLLGSFVLFTMFAFWLGTIKIEQVDRMEAKIIRFPQASKVINVALHQSQQHPVNHRHGFLQSYPSSEFTELLARINVLTQNLANIQAHAIATQTLFKSITPLIPAQTAAEEKGFLYMRKLPTSAINSFKPGELVQISLENENNTDLISGEIIAIAPEGFTVEISSKSQESHRPRYFLMQKPNTQNAKMTNPNVTIEQVRSAQIIRHQRVVDLFWKNLHPPENSEIN